MVKEWARLEGLHPQTVWKWCRQGTMPVPVEQTPTGMWLIHDPKYETMDVAYKRAGTFGATVVLGSATPSVVSFYRASVGIYHLIELKNRVGKSRLPDV